MQGHRDLDETGGTVPTNKPDPALIQELIDSTDGHKVTLENLLQFKAKREIRAKISDAYPKASLKVISHGELVLATEVLQHDGPGIPVEWFKAWFLEERLPEGLNPPNTTGLLSTHSKAGTVSEKIAALHVEAAKERRNA
jgi:Peroxidase, family 2